MTTPISTRISIKPSSFGTKSLSEIAFALRRVTTLTLLASIEHAKDLCRCESITLERGVIHPKYWDLSTTEFADFCDLVMSFPENEYKSRHEQIIHDYELANRLMQAGAEGDAASAIEFCKMCADGRYSPNSAFAP